MNPTAIFIIGAVIFAITIYGAVMTGGLYMTRSELAQDDDLVVDGEEAATAANLPVNVKY